MLLEVAAYEDDEDDEEISKASTENPNIAQGELRGSNQILLENMDEVAVQVEKQGKRKLTPEMSEEEQFEILFQGDVADLIKEIEKREGDLYDFLKNYVYNMIDLYLHKQKIYMKEVDKIDRYTEDTHLQMQRMYKSIYNDKLTKAIYNESNFRGVGIPKKEALGWNAMEERVAVIKNEFFPRYNSVVINLGKFKNLVAACSQKLKELESLKTTYFEEPTVAGGGYKLRTRSGLRGFDTFGKPKTGKTVEKESQNPEDPNPEDPNPEDPNPEDPNPEVQNSEDKQTEKRKRTPIQLYDDTVEEQKKANKLAEIKVNNNNKSKAAPSKGRQKKNPTASSPTATNTSTEIKPKIKPTKTTKKANKLEQLEQQIKQNEWDRGVRHVETPPTMAELEAMQIGHHKQAVTGKNLFQAAMQEAQKRVNNNARRRNPRQVADSLEDDDNEDEDDDVEDDEGEDDDEPQIKRRRNPPAAPKPTKPAVTLLTELINILKECFEDIQMLSTHARKDMRNKICRIVLNMGSPLKNSKPNRFLNIVLTGDAGMGKSLAANCIGKVMAKSGILCSEGFYEPDAVTPKDFIGQYMGETAIKTYSLLQQNFERVLFCDEAYGFVNCTRDEDGNAVLEKSTGGNQYGNEAMTEMLTFMDKYQGLHVLIIAGYSSSIYQCFFGVNPGLMRRFPEMFDLNEYSNNELFIIYKNLMKPLEDKGIRIGHTMKKFIEETGRFKNQAGDMQNLFMFYQQYLSNAARQHNVEDNTNEDILALLEKVESKAITQFKELIQHSVRTKKKPQQAGYLKKTRRRRASIKYRKHNNKHKSKTKSIL